MGVCLLTHRTLRPVCPAVAGAALRTAASDAVPGRVQGAIALLLEGHVPTMAAAQAFLVSSDPPHIDISEELARLAIFKVLLALAACYRCAWLLLHLLLFLVCVTCAVGLPREMDVGRDANRVHALHIWFLGECQAHVTQATLCVRTLMCASCLQEAAGLSDVEVDRAVVAAEGDLDAAVAALHERQHPAAPLVHAANGGARPLKAGGKPAWQGEAEVVAPMARGVCCCWESVRVCFVDSAQQLKPTP